MEPLTLSITGMSCGHCVAGVRRALAAVPGVQVDDVQIGTATVHAADDRDTQAAIIDAIADAGYDATIAHPKD